MTTFVAWCLQCRAHIKTSILEDTFYAGFRVRAECHGEQREVFLSSMLIHSGSFEIAPEGWLWLAPEGASLPDPQRALPAPSAVRRLPLEIEI